MRRMHTRPTPPTTTWLAIAFLRGDPYVPRDRSIALFTRGPFVHTEVLLGKGEQDVRAYAAFDGVSGFVPSSARHSRHASRWALVKYPLPPGGYEKVYAWILQMLAAKLPYNQRDLWQCAVKICLPFETDLDCTRPDTWGENGGVFCSQAALLLLRRGVQTGIITLADDKRAKRVEGTNSRGCSPNDLFRILTSPTPASSPQKKEMKVPEAFRPKPVA
jgi:hypothetical protein